MSFAWHEIRDHLMQSSTNLNFQRSFDAVRREQAALAAFRDPAALLDGLHRTPGDQGQKNVILSALVGAVQGDGPASDCALTVLLLALWPGLDAIRHRSIWRRLGTADEVASDVWRAPPRQSAASTSGASTGSRPRCCATSSAT